MNTEKTRNFLKNNFNINEKVVKLINGCEAELMPAFAELDEITEYNQYKVLNAFQKNRISDNHFNWNTGYGYDDIGRDAVEKVYADIFHTEKALVRTQIVNGTHALAITLFGILRPGDEMIYCTGGPYDTLEEVIGIRGSGMGSLTEYGIKYKQVELDVNDNIDMETLKASISDKTKLVCMQRSTGYSWRKSIDLEQMRSVVELVRKINPDILVMVDNCYGEFVKEIEPTDVGVDIIAGSLIKNPGGGLALSGGYVCASKEIVDRIAYRLTCPGIGSECGLTFGQTRTVLQGVFLAPKTVNAAVKGAMLCAKVYEKLGFEVCPDSKTARNDIIQAIRLETEERVVAFCEGIQSAAPIDSHVVPVPWAMPGYEDDVVMAAGAFIQGSSIELSADAPVRAPYNVYFQGGLTYEHAKFGVIKSLNCLHEKNLLKKEI
ncbi:MAG: methionine gamma-lyase family protein [Eubacterium sp.]|nr:methionine gamma-lyase family protein [Eubacterium sp.]